MVLNTERKTQMKIKVSKKYNLPVECTEISGGDVKLEFRVSETQKYGFFLSQLTAESVLSPIPAAPKYDPCRLFRKGDEVELREIRGRKNKKLNYNYKYNVVSDEDEYGAVAVEWFNSRGMICSTSVLSIWLELVTPVEELNPFVVKQVYETMKGEDGLIGYEVVNAEGLPEIIFFGGKGKYRVMQDAKAAAEAECARLNEEWKNKTTN